jgi:gliding motility-associated-like protein
VVDKTQNSRCDAVLFADVTVADFPLLSILPNNADKKIIACQDEIVSLNSKDISHAANFKYEWRKVGSATILATTPKFDLTYSVAGNYELQKYTVRVIPPSGCASNDEISVQFVEKAIAKIADNYPKQICLGETFSLEASGGNTYKWTSNEPSNAEVGSSAKVTVKPKTSGTFTYTVEVSNDKNASLCKSTTIAVRVQVNPALAAKILALNNVAITNKEIKVCENISPILEGFDGTQPASVRYVWRNTNKDQIIGTNSQQIINFATLQPKQTTTENYETQLIELAVSDLVTGCVRKDTVKFTFERKAKPIIQAPKEVCVGDTITLFANDGSLHRWNDGNVEDTTIQILGSSNAATLTVVHKEAGLKRYWVASKFNNSCTESVDMVQILVNPLPVAVAHTNKNIKVCAGNQVTLRASGGVAYLWKHGASTAETTVTVNTDSCFVVTVFNASGCKSKDSVYVKVTPIKKLPPRLLFCDREVGELDATNPDPAPATYSWNSGLVTPKIKISKPGIYTVKVKIANCEYQQTCEVIYKNTPKIALKADTLLCFALKDEAEEAPYRMLTHKLGATLLNREAGETYLYEWRIKGNPTIIGSGVIGNDNVAPLTVGRMDTTYIVRMTSKSANCTTEAAIKVRVNCTGRIKIPSAFSPNGDKLNDTFAPLTSDLTGILIQVYQKWGEIIYEKSISHLDNKGWDGTFKAEEGWDGTLNGTEVPMDTYQYVLVYWSKDQKGKTVRGSQTGTVTVVRK